MILETIKIPINTKSTELMELGLSDSETILRDAYIVAKQISMILDQPDGDSTIFLMDGGDITTPLSVKEIMEKIERL